MRLTLLAALACQALSLVSAQQDWSGCPGACMNDCNECLSVWKDGIECSDSVYGPLKDNCNSCIDSYGTDEEKADRYSNLEFLNCN
ncbi:hypothetical protein BDW62DRAFT_171356 [Aspergillus aurantiobrunneus]